MRLRFPLLEIPDAHNLRSAAKKAYEAELSPQPTARLWARLNPSTEARDVIVRTFTVRPSSCRSWFELTRIAATTANDRQPRLRNLHHLSVCPPFPKILLTRWLQIIPTFTYALLPPSPLLLTLRPQSIIYVFLVSLSVLLPLPNPSLTHLAGPSSSRGTILPPVSSPTTGPSAPQDSATSASVRPSILAASLADPLAKGSDSSPLLSLLRYCRIGSTSTAR